MEFVYRAAGQMPDLSVLECALADLDPAVILDANALGRSVRISTTLPEDDLLACLQRAGVQASPADLERLPSVCCGGCGG